MKDITILFSACSSPSAPGMFHFLKNVKERKIKIVGVDIQDDPSVYFMVDSFYQVPAATAPNYVDIVLGICKKENVTVYFPNISVEVEAVVARKNEFDTIGVKLSVSNIDSIRISNNKLRTYQMLQKAGISVPKFYGVHSVEEFIAGCKHMGYPAHPVCLKIVDGSGSRGVRIIDATRSRYEIFVHEKPNSFFTSYEDMLNVLKQAGDNFHEMMLVEYMPGNEYTVDLLAEKGKILYQVGRENVVSLMSIAQESILVKDEEAYRVSSQVVELLNVDGNMGFDFMRTADGRPVLMDINPRITATVSVVAAGGVNLMYLRIKQLLDEEMPRCEPIYGTRLKRRYGEIYTAPDGSRIE